MKSMKRRLGAVACWLETWYNRLRWQADISGCRFGEATYFIDEVRVPAVTIGAWPSTKTALGVECPECGRGPGSVHTKDCPRYERREVERLTCERCGAVSDGWRRL